MLCTPESAFENAARAFEMWHELEPGFPSEGGGRREASLSINCMPQSGIDLFTVCCACMCGCVCAHAPGVGM